MKKSSFTSFKQKYGVSLLLFLIFEIIAVALTLKSGNIFYLANFSYIGSALAVSLALYANGKTYARRLVQFLIGSYMLVYLGILSHENMQIEGFWYYLFLGTFEAAVIHYLVAKILGPLLFGRGWCGYACWSAMIFDLLPYKTPQKPRKNLGFLRYITFSASIIFVALLFYFNAANIALIMWYAFIVDHANRRLNQIAHHALDIAPNVAHLGKLRRFYFDKRRFDQFCQAASDLCFADAGGTNHDNIGRRDLRAQIII